MPYTIESLFDLGIISVDATGAISQEMRKETYLKSGYDLKSAGFHKLLVDVTDSTIKDNNKSRTINTLDMVMFMYTNRVTLKKPLKIAVLSLDREGSHRNFIRLAQIIGRLNIKYFTSRDKAINWLLME